MFAMIKSFYQLRKSKLINSFFLIFHQKKVVYYLGVDILPEIN